MASALLGGACVEGAIAGYRLAGVRGIFRAIRADERDQVLVGGDPLQAAGENVKKGRFPVLSTVRRCRGASSAVEREGLEGVKGMLHKEEWVCCVK